MRRQLTKENGESFRACFGQFAESRRAFPQKPRFQFRVLRKIRFAFPAISRFGLRFPCPSRKPFRLFFCKSLVSRFSM